MWSIDRIEGEYALAKIPSPARPAGFPSRSCPQGQGRVRAAPYPAGWQRAEEEERARRRAMAAKVRNLFGKSPFRE